MNVLLITLFTAIVSSAGFAQAAPGTGTSGPLSSSLFAPVKLRGYGVVSGTVLSRTERGTLIRVSTENPKKAQLFHAKFLSDFHLLPGVQPVEFTVRGVKMAVLEVQKQGVVMALRQGKDVFLIAARDKAQSLLLLKALPMAALKASRPEVKVPMLLDRWDQFSFRHYYRPWETPAGAQAGYDFVHEFDYAKTQDRAGFVFWDDALSNDTAESMMNFGWWDWAADEARNRDLPVGINFSGVGSTWMLNRYREQTQLKMPGFTGNFRDMKSPYLGGTGGFSWSATTAEQAALGIMQGSVRTFAAYPNVTSFLEPHGELNHGPQNILLEYGPVVDVQYRQYLQEKYGTVDKVAARWNRPLTSWEDVRLPELVSFAGWGADSLDLGGLWHIGYEELTGPIPSAYYYDRFGAPKSKPAPEEWFQPGFDVSSWPEVPAPGNDRQLFLVKRPAVFRRDFDVLAAWKAKHPRVWLYLWDLDGAANEEVRVVLNGKEIERSKVTYFVPRWSAVEVTSVLQAGKNTIAVRLPQGNLSYKTYLSPVEPKQYPELGKGLNAQWVDLSDFTQWSRVQAVKGGMEMIRQAAPDHQITLHSPLSYADGVKEMAVTYGGNFHDTGAMGAFWMDYPASLMRGVDMPLSLEPGGPAESLPEWKKQMGLYQTEGIQGIDYFIHIGSILWKPEIKADYEAHRKQLSLLGQSHYTKAEVACLYSDQIAQLTGFPWGAAPNAMLAGGYFAWNTASVLRGKFSYDGLTQSSFARGEAKPYRVIVDSNTSIMDEAMVADIEKWVRDGGTFITIAQTGRHTPEIPNAWPISRLTGYNVTHIDRLKPDGGIDESGTLQVAPAQHIYDAAWNGIRANGLHLQKVAPDVQDLLLWNDGTVAAGMRPLGKGFIVQLGAKFTGSTIYDRVEPGGNTAEAQQLRQLLTALLQWRGVKQEFARLAPENESVWLRPAVTNNGLYDTWTVWNWSSDKSQTVNVTLEKGKNPSFAIEVRDGKSFPVTASPEGARLENIVLQPLETRVFLTPRNEIAQAPLAWFDLQRKWWRGTKVPPAQVLPQTPQRFARDLTPSWKFQFLSETMDAQPFLTTSFDDQRWGTRPLAVWDTTEAKATRHGVFRKSFTVPAEWSNGKVSLWMTSWWNTSFVGKGRVVLDGKEVKGLNSDPYVAIGLPDLKPGTAHTLAVEVQGDSVLAGLRGQAWISFEPTAPDELNLAGQWQPSVDGLRYTAPITLPGNYNAQFLRRTFSVDAKHRGKNVVLTVEGDSELVSVLINGTLIRRHHHRIGDRWSLNLTPFIRWGADNEIEIVRWESSGAGSVREISLGFFDPKFYP